MEVDLVIQKSPLTLTLVYKDPEEGRNHSTSQIPVPVPQPTCTSALPFYVWVNKYVTIHQSMLSCVMQHLHRLEQANELIIAYNKSELQAWFLRYVYRTSASRFKRHHLLM